MKRIFQNLVKVGSSGKGRGWRSLAFGAGWALGKLILSRPGTKKNISLRPVEQVKERLLKRKRGAYLLDILNFEKLKRIGDKAFDVLEGEVVCFSKKTDNFIISIFCPSYSFVSRIGDKIWAESAFILIPVGSWSGWVIYCRVVHFRSL